MSDQQLRIAVRLPTHERVTVSVPSSASVVDLKAAIEHATAIVAPAQKLIFASHVMVNDKPLKFYGTRAGSLRSCSCSCCLIFLILVGGRGGGVWSRAAVGQDSLSTNRCRAHALGAGSRKDTSPGWSLAAPRS